jgi:phosphoribosyl-AMP cyclohydrolase
MSLLDAVDFSKANGLVTAIAQDAQTREILMVAHMNEDALRRTLETGEVVYWSRSRQRLWHKGEESGNVQRVRELRIDCDGDVVLLLVEQVGGSACHTGKRSCFFRYRNDEIWGDDGVQVFDPEKVYRR